MANIGTRTFNLVDDKYLSLANEEWVRTLVIGTDWTKLRIGMLISVTPDPGVNLSGVELIWGLCSGKTNPFGAAITTNFLGMKFGISSGGDLWTYTANSGNPYYHSEKSVIKKIGGTKSITAGGAGQTHRISTTDGALQRRSVQFMEITKGNPSFVVTQWGTPLGGMSKDFTPAHLLDGLEQSGSISVNGESFGGGIVANYNFDEIPGALDTVNIFWNKSAFPLEIHAVGAYRHA